jgi:hypothetical protein
MSPDASLITMVNGVPSAYMSGWPKAGRITGADGMKT